MFLKVWGDPWVSPERSHCCYFFDFKVVSDILCFSANFHRYFKAMMLLLKTKTYVFSILILGGQHVAISLVLAVTMKIRVFPQVLFQ